MASGGGDVDVPRPRAQESTGQRRRHRQAASLPLDVIADIAARSDPATLVRCAATCSDLRGRVDDPGFRLRLRHADRFVPSLTYA
uniref:F-box domain-containing protein n=1 Tax=Setaria italica TaxID=4555 RepID=K4A390_SETIT